MKPICFQVTHFKCQQIQHLEGEDMRYIGIYRFESLEENIYMYFVFFFYHCNYLIWSELNRGAVHHSSIHQVDHGHLLILLSISVTRPLLLPIQVMTSDWVK